jgi:hypothetical protein
MTLVKITDGCAFLSVASLSAANTDSCINSNLIAIFALSEARRPEMWAKHQPTADETQDLATCSQSEWEVAVNKLLRHWQTPPTWSDGLACAKAT